MCASVLKCLVSFDRAEGEREGARILTASEAQLSLPEPCAAAMVAHLGSLSYVLAAQQVISAAGDPPGTPGQVLYERGGRAIRD